jgi:hypothetical protein
VKLFLEKTDAGIVFKMASAADEKIIFSQGTINL